MRDVRTLFLYNRLIISKFLIVFQYQKPKSSIGYYSQGNTPNNNTGRIIPQSKTPDIYNYQSNNFKTRKIQSQVPGGNNINKQMMN
jgi:hypothetical protein